MKLFLSSPSRPSLVSFITCLGSRNQMDARKGEIGLLDVEAATLWRMSRQLLSMQLHLRLGLGVIVCSGCSGFPGGCLLFKNLLKT